VSSDLTAIDLFCGAGGSSSGMVAAGIKVRFAANHWRRAIETHEHNHPTTEHDCADIRQVHPSAYPRTNFFWASPECSSHSLAKGRKRKNINQLDLWGNTQVDPEEERSRATMREVIEFAAYHKHEFIIVENVVDIRYWQHYEAWLTEMINLGYEHKILYLNAQFFGVPQSRDRFYAVFWRKGNKAPDLDFRPAAICPEHGRVLARQSWKKPAYEWGRYGARRQYVYRCPSCHSEVTPVHIPAWTVIDWSIPSVPIGEREKPLQPKTLARIREGIRKYARQVLTVNIQYTDTGRPVTEPMPTQTGRQSLAVLMPFIAEYYGKSSARDVLEALATIASHEHHGLVVPPFMAELRNNSSERSLDEALATIVAGGLHHSLVVPPFLAQLKGDLNGTGIDDPLSTIIASTSQQALITPFMLSYYNNETGARSVDEALYTIATSHTPPLFVPSFLLQYYSRQDAQSGLDQPMPVIPTEPRHSLVSPPLIASVNYFDDRCISVDQPLPTQTTANKTALVTPASLTDSEVEDILNHSGFRMLSPEELKRGMGFAPSYTILGNKREQVRQAGNAVCPPIAQMIVERCAETLQ
jgi:DNA (cytosine-5)-methyltransferase 1